MNALNWTRGEPPKDGRWYAATGNLVYKDSPTASATNCDHFQKFLRFDAKIWVGTDGMSLIMEETDVISWHWHTPAPQLELEAS